MACGTLWLAGSQTSLKFPCQAIAIDGNSLLAAWVVGSASAVKAFRAALFTDVGCDMRWADPAGNTTTLYRADGGYDKLRPERLPPKEYQTWTAGVASKRAGFCPSLDEQTLWEALNEKTTTPILREWMPALLTKLEEEDLLQRSDCYCCNAGSIAVTDKELDAIVGDLLRKGKIEIPRTHAARKTA